MPAHIKIRQRWLEREALWLLIALLAAALTRFWRSDIVEYFHDDAMLASLALEMAAGTRFPLTGILSSTGIPNSPVSVYLLALPFAFTSEIQSAIHFVMLWNTLGVALLWLIARRYFGRTVAAIASLAYALNPWAALFSRKLWAQELHTPIFLLALLVLLYGYFETRSSNRRRLAFLAQCCGPPLLLIAAQFHFAAAPLLLLFPLALWAGRRRLDKRALASAILLCALALLPYAAGLTRTLEADPTRISDALARSADSAPQFSLASISAAIRLATGWDLGSWLAPGLPLQASPLTLLALPLIGLGMQALWRKWRRLAAPILICALLPYLILLVEWTPVYIHYFIPSLPALALLSGLGAGRLLGWAGAKSWLRSVVLLGLALMFAAQALELRGAIDLVAGQHIDYPGFTTPLARLLPIRERLAPAKDALVVSGGMAWNLHHEVAVWDTLLWDEVACVRTLVPEGYAVFPAGPFVALVAPDAQRGPSLERYRRDDFLSFPTRAGGPVYELHQWESPPAWTGPPLARIEPRRFENGVELTGFHWGDDRVTLEWALPGQRVGADYQFSAQAFDAAGQRLAQLDATFWHGRHWCAGDRLLTWGPMPDQANAASLKVALYRLGTGSAAGRALNAQVLDEMGKPQGHSVDIPLQGGA